jgi:hypothetical protein
MPDTEPSDEAAGSGHGADRSADPGANRDAGSGPEGPAGRPPPRPADERPPGGDFADFEDLGGRPPPGWERRAGAGEDGGDRPPPRAIPDAGQLLALLDGLRGAVPRELQDQITTLMREFLLALRALIDWYLERLDAPRREPDIEDIPID